jgi:U3 small nucleolar RNA-associated protein 19
MFVISFIANMIKRHPRCVRLIHRKRKIYKDVPTFTSDPYLASEQDPSKTKALKSSLWEIETLIKSEFDETVRNYSKLFKSDLSRKTNFFKCEDFSGIDALDILKTDLNSINLIKE